MSDDEGKAEGGRARWKPGETLPFARFWWRDWLSDPALRRLTPEQRGRFMDVWAATYGSKEPGAMTEDDVRGWAGYTPEEWKAVREDFARLFWIPRRRGRWFIEAVRRDHAATVEVTRRAYERAMKGVAARSRRKDLATTGSTPATGTRGRKATRVQPQVEPQLDTEVQIPELQTPETQTTDKSDSDSRAARAQKARSRAGSAGSAGSSRELPLEGVITRAFDGNPPARRGSA